MSAEKKLPDGWEVKKLREIITLEYGKPLSPEMRKTNGQYPVYGANGSIAWTDEYYYDQKTIIVGRKGSAGEVNLSTERFWPLDVTYFVKYEKQEIDLVFLFFFLKKIDLCTLAKGVKPGINREDVYSTEILLPPLSEQKRIVAILDDAFQAIDKAKENAQKNLTNARELFESYLNQVFSNPGKDWEEKKLGEILQIKHGYAFEGEYFSTEGKYILLTPGNFFEKGGYRDRGEKQKYFTGPIPQDFILQENDLLVAMTEQAAGLLGSTIIVPEDNKFLHNQRLGLITPLPGTHWDKRFISYLFNTKYVREAIESSASGVKVRHTSPSKIYGISTRIPKNITIQKGVIDSLDSISSNTQRLESIYTKKLAALDELKKSILQKAFSGEL